MTTVGAKSDGTRDFLHNFGAAAASCERSLTTLGVNSKDGSSVTNNRVRTLDLLRNFCAAAAPCEPGRKRKREPSLELTLALPSVKNPKKKFCKSELPRLPNPPPDLPRKFRQHIESLRGREVKLVMQKVLTCSDLSSHLARLMLPENQIVGGGDFLSREESTQLNNKKDIAVGVVSSNLREKELNLKLWLMGKKPKVEEGPVPKATRVYALQRGWVGFARENELKEMDRLQLWSFRVEDKEARRDALKFVIVKLEGNDDEDRGGDDDDEADVHPQ